MLFEPVISLIVATGLLLGSPGPAPLALAATGATYGIRKGIPFLIGILFGLSFAIVGASVGLAALFSAFPNLQIVCQLIGAAYIVYIAYKIATAPTISNDISHCAPQFKDGFILNLLNPKAYAAFLAIFTQFLLPFSDIWLSYTATGLTCLFVATVVDILWLCFGGLLKPIFKHPLHARVVRITFAVLMISAVIYAFF